jgi:capsid protein
LAGREDVERLKAQLVTRYADLAGIAGEINEVLIKETRHWLEEYSNALVPYNQALQKYDQGVFQRNILDDLRLSLEILVREILGNEKSLENQLGLVRRFRRDEGWLAGIRQHVCKAARLLCEISK